MAAPASCFCGPIGKAVIAVANVIDFLLVMALACPEIPGKVRFRYGCVVAVLSVLLFFLDREAYQKWQMEKKEKRERENNCTPFAPGGSGPQGSGGNGGVGATGAAETSPESHFPGQKAKIGETYYGATGTPVPQPLRITSAPARLAQIATLTGAPEEEIKRAPEQATMTLTVPDLEEGIKRAPEPAV